MKILDSPKCSLCNHPMQDSTYSFFFCPQARLTWQLLTNITSDSPCPHQFTFTTAILNVPDISKNHPLIIPTNLTRQINDKAHTNGVSIHPNTVFHKLHNYSSIFSHNDTKFSIIWSSLSTNCSNLLKPNNPQVLSI